MSSLGYPIYTAPHWIFSEKERADNIRKNAELLAMLDVEAIHDDMGIPAPVATGKGKGKAGGASSSTASKPKPVPARNAKVKREREEDSGPLRRSTRRRTGPVDLNESPQSKRKREVSGAKAELAIQLWRHGSFRSIRPHRDFAGGRGRGTH